MLIHRGYYILKYLLLVILLGLSLLGAYCAVMYHPLWWLMTLTFLIFSFMVPFKRMELHSDRLKYQEYSLGGRFKLEKEFRFDQIEKMEIYPGFFDKKFFLLSIFLANSMFRGNSKPASIDISLEGEETIALPDFGSKKAYLRFANEVVASWKQAKGKS